MAFHLYVEFYFYAYGPYWNFGYVFMQKIIIKFIRIRILNLNNFFQIGFSIIIPRNSIDALLTRVFQGYMNYSVVSIKRTGEQKFHLVHEKKISVVKKFHIVHEKKVRGGKKLQS